ncbi:MAG: hypothetical protein AB1411_16595, partial [Nitrospirota bacterium]
LLETVAEIGKDMKAEGSRTIRLISVGLILGSILIALLNLLAVRPRRKETSAAWAVDRPELQRSE